MQVKWIRHTRVTCCRCPFCHICIKIWRIRRLRLENSANSPFFQKLMAKKRKFQVKWIRNIQISYSQHPSCHILSKCEDIAASASKTKRICMTCFDLFVSINQNYLVNIYVFIKKILENRGYIYESIRGSWQDGCREYGTRMCIYLKFSYFRL